jgi:cytidylate kinase
MSETGAAPRPRPIVAIDGPSGVGKSTVAKGVAKALDFSLVDTGALYRAVAWLADKNGTDWDSEPELARLVSSHCFAFTPEGTLLLDGKPLGDRLRTSRISEGASAVARHPELRRALLAVQRRLGENGGIVLEGRDIGTAIFPDAEIKFFLTASARVRAKRRYLELKERGEDIALDEVEQAQLRRDEADQNRTISPLRRADDAEVVESDDMTAREVIQLMVNRIRAKSPPQVVRT